jgi:hypothetical protein
MTTSTPKLDCRPVNPHSPPPLADIERWLLRRLNDGTGRPCWLIRLKESGLVCSLYCGDLAALPMAGGPFTMQRALLGLNGQVTYGPECALPEATT